MTGADCFGCAEDGGLAGGVPIGGALSKEPADAVPQAGQKFAASGICLPQWWQKAASSGAATQNNKRVRTNNSFFI